MDLENQRIAQSYGDQKYIYHVDGRLPRETSWVWVFGSNLAGIHGAGAAKVARDLYGRKYGVQTAYGPYISGDLQESYAIPTKNPDFEVLTIDEIMPFVETFKKYAYDNPGKLFFVTRVGCGFAGNADSEIAPLFIDSPLNCNFPYNWKEFLE